MPMIPLRLPGSRIPGTRVIRSTGSGIPVENGECTLSYIPDFGMKVIWSGAGGDDTPVSFPYNADLHGALDRTGILDELKTRIRLILK